MKYEKCLGTPKYCRTWDKIERRPGSNTLLHHLFRSANRDRKTWSIEDFPPTSRRVFDFLNVNLFYQFVVFSGIILNDGYPQFLGLKYRRIFLILRGSSCGETVFIEYRGVSVCPYGFPSSLAFPNRRLVGGFLFVHGYGSNNGLVAREVNCGAGCY